MRQYGQVVVVSMIVRTPVKQTAIDGAIFKKKEDNNLVIESTKSMSHERVRYGL